MSLNADPAPQRRRGAALENALLTAAWDELDERGYDDFTVDGVAARAGTSRAVLYRRWPGGKPELVHAALVAAMTKTPITVPDNGSLRADVIDLLRQANSQRGHLAVTVVTRLGGFYRDTGISLSELRAVLEGERGATMDKLVARAIARGRFGPIRSRAASRSCPSTCFVTTCCSRLPL